MGACVCAGAGAVVGQLVGAREGESVGDAVGSVEESVGERVGAFVAKPWVLLKANLSEIARRVRRCSSR